MVPLHPRLSAAAIATACCCLATLPELAVAQPTAAPATGVPPTPSPPTLVPVGTDAPPAVTDAPQPAWAPPPVPTLVQWCAGDDRCREEGDVGGRCSNETLQCTCSSHYGPQVQHGEWRYDGCYPQRRTALLVVDFPSGACTGSDVPPVSQRAVVAAVDAATLGQVTTAAFLCSPVRAALTVDVPASTADRITAAALQQAIAAEVTKTAEAKATLGPDAAALLTISPVDAPPLGEGETAAPPAQGVPQVQRCALDNAASALQLQVGTARHCVATQCVYGHVKSLKAAPGYGFECIITPHSGFTGGCLVRGDCTFSPGRTQCSSNKECVAAEPAAPVKQTESLRVPTSMSKDFCLEDSDCALHGDTEAACIPQVLQGSYCNCSAGFDFPAAHLGMCMAKGVSRVPLAFSVALASAGCASVTREVKTQLTAVITNQLGQVVQLDHSCTPVTLFGIANVNALTADGLATGSIDLLALLQADALRYPGLSSLGDITSAGVGQGRECVLPYATVTRIDHAGRCQAISCVAATPRRLVDGVYVCTAAVAQGGGDDGMPSRDKVALGLAGGCVLLLLGAALLVAAVNVKKQRRLAKENAEPTAPA